jgi:DNA-binding response OmpR family regulator
MLRRRILVVDDDLDLRGILRDRLMHRGHKRDMIHRAVGLRGGELLGWNSCDRWCRRIMPLERSAFGR